MKLIIIDTDTTVEHNVDWVELNTPAGNMTLQQNHAPMIIELSPSKELVFQLSSGNLEKIEVVQGVVHVTREYVKILFPLKV